jgi:excinuclease UvrABC ATPase subunit
LKYAASANIDTKIPYDDLPDFQQNCIIYGDEGWRGVKGFFQWLETKKYKLHVRVFLAKYRGYTKCPDCGGTRLMLEDRSILEASTLHNDSVLYFQVADIHAAHDELRRRGVEFTHAPHMIAKHPDGTEEWMAFFRDSEGAMLAIMSQVKPALPLV